MVVSTSKLSLESDETLYAGVPISYKYSGAISKRPSCQETVHPSNWNWLNNCLSLSDANKG